MVPSQGEYINRMEDVPLRKVRQAGEERRTDEPQGYPWLEDYHGEQSAAHPRPSG